MGPTRDAEVLAFAQAIAREASELLVGAFYQRPPASYKRQTTDVVTAADLASEDLVRRRIAERFPEHAILAEERGGAPLGGGPTWVVDPLDGTTNFAHGLPWFSVSVAFVDGGEPVAGVVRTPLLGWEWSAARGGGTHQDGRPVSVSATATLTDALLGTGFPYDRQVSEDDNLAEFGVFQKRVQAVRRLGSAALDLALVSAGAYDGYWEQKLNPWDIAAGVLLVREAGGRVTAYDGGPVDLARGQVLASNGRIHDELRAVIAAARAGRGS